VVACCCTDVVNQLFTRQKYAALNQIFEGDIMKQRINIFDFVNCKRASAAPVVCEAPLAMLPKFDEFCSPINVDRNADGVMGTIGIDVEKAKERKALRLQFLKEELEKTKNVPPFLVWKDGERRVIVDARHDEYAAAVEMGLPIHVIDCAFASQDEAFAFMAMHQLNKPHLNAAQRMLLVRELEDTVRQLAKNNQGTRNDIASSKSDKTIHTMEILAALANVGEQTLRRFYAIIDQGDTYLKAGKAKEFIERILADNMSVNQAWNSLRDAKQKRQDNEAFANSNAALFKAGNTCDSVPGVDDEPDSSAPVYQNPCFDNGFHNQIVCGDRVEVLGQLPDGWCNLVVTSPEYNLENVLYDVPVPVLPYYEYLQSVYHL